MRKALVWDKRASVSAGNKTVGACVAALLIGVPSHYWMNETIPVALVIPGTLLIQFAVDRLVSKYCGSCDIN